MSEISAPQFSERTAGHSKIGRRRMRAIATIALAIVVATGVFGVGGAFAFGKIRSLEHQRNGLRRDNAALQSVKAHDEAALKAGRI
jgi:hypothetical protein